MTIRRHYFVLKLVQNHSTSESTSWSRSLSFSLFFSLAHALSHRTFSLCRSQIESFESLGIVDDLRQIFLQMVVVDDGGCVKRRRSRCDSRRTIRLDRPTDGCWTVSSLSHKHDYVVLGAFTFVGIKYRAISFFYLFLFFFFLFFFSSQVHEDKDLS